MGKRKYFVEWLHTQMIQRGWSQSDLARYSKLNRSIIHRLANGKGRPQPTTLAAISRAFRLPVEIAYRAAGFLPSKSEGDELLEEAIYSFRNLHNGQRKGTAIILLKVLLAEEEEEITHKHHRGNTDMDKI